MYIINYNKYRFSITITTAYKYNFDFLWEIGFTILIFKELQPTDTFVLFMKRLVTLVRNVLMNHRVGV